MKSETPQMDWQQVALNGGPPCFAQLDDEDGYYCGRAQRWEGHDGEHKFVSLDDLLNTERERCAKIADERARELQRMATAKLLDAETVARFRCQSAVCSELAQEIRGKQ